MGEITNTNTVYLSQKLNDHGIDVLYHHTVGDNPDRLSRVLADSLEDCDLIITTGGLGPTQDDMTKELVCEFFEDHLVMNEGWLQNLYDRYEKRGRRMTDNNRKQALLPSRSIILFNEVGSAPGFVLRDPAGEKTICCLPGPPREMKWLYENKLSPLLAEQEGGVLCQDCATPDAKPFPDELRRFIIGLRDFDWQGGELRLSSSLLVAAEEVLLTYLQDLLGRPLKSLAFIQQLSMTG